MATPGKEIHGRLGAIRRAMKRQRLGGLLLTRPEEVRYASGFTGEDAALLVTARRLVLVTDSRYTEEAAASAPLAETVLWRGRLFSFLGAQARRRGIRRLGFDAGHLSVAAHTLLRKAARGVETSPAENVVAAIRACKSPWEVRKIHRALRCAETALEGLREELRPGMRESEVRLELEWRMRRAGAQEAGFETIAAAGPNAALPHAHAGGRRTRRGGLLLLDFGARVDGYCSDLTRVFFFDSIPGLWRRRLEAVLEAQRAGLAALAPGATCAGVDRAAREALAPAEREAFTHALGHGVGLAVHEAPRLSRASEEILRPGMVVTVEPGLYYPRRGGLRIEDMALVTETGARRLSRLSRDPAWMVV
jgi:Xaa-Pro aminopeptidase